MWQAGLSFNCDNPLLCADMGGIPAVPGRYNTTDVLGFGAPGVAIQIQVAFQPAK